MTNTSSLSVAEMSAHWNQWLLRVGVGLLVVLGMLWLSLLNRFATEGFGLEGVKQERIALQKEYERTAINSSLPRTLYGLERVPQVQEMVLVQTRRYLDTSGQRLAFEGGRY